MNKKPEYMTSLGGSALVPKTHVRIAFRGAIDTLEAEVIEAQVLASEQRDLKICACLGEVLDFLRLIMAAEVKGTPLPPPFLFGMEAEEIHRLVGEMDWKTSPFPSHTQGPLAARINTLRAKVREAELLSVKVFGPQDEAKAAERQDIILALNRLSSALWWLFVETTRACRAGQNTL